MKLWRSILKQLQRVESRKQQSNQQTEQRGRGEIVCPFEVRSQLVRLGEDGIVKLTGPRG